MQKTRWGILGCARIAVTKVITAMLKSEMLDIVAVASRDRNKAAATADAFGIGRSYGSYEDLLSDPEVEVVYIPLPNHLHVPWSIRAAEAGKHVLCEKPISLTVDECSELIAARDRTGVKIGEAFAVTMHPQWIRARELVKCGAIGRIRSIIAAFSYFLDDPGNVRNILDIGGGGIMDIGCYPIKLSRFLYGGEPVSVAAVLERDPEMKIDRLSSVVLGFPSGQSIFTCATQLARHQNFQIVGTKGGIELPVPFNPSPDKECRLVIDNCNDLYGGGVTVEEVKPCDQYTIQAESFSLAVRGHGDVANPLGDSIKNMAVIDAVFESARSRTIVCPRSV